MLGLVQIQVVQMPEGWAVLGLKNDGSLVHAQLLLDRGRLIVRWGPVEERTGA